jgi:hypothetical protein
MDPHVWEHNVPQKHGLDLWKNSSLSSSQDAAPFVTHLSKSQIILKN